ncbi:hypothetical protein VTN00DRAFT_7701 [Thermoascus crustaceus]|uniref:uncharacterized protein n=1 Tax=Thermoascus crustaceus TaxID=5088 RepID=UPI003742458F
MLDSKPKVLAWNSLDNTILLRLDTKASIHSFFPLLCPITAYLKKIPTIWPYHTQVDFRLVARKPFHPFESFSRLICTMK